MRVLAFVVVPAVATALHAPTIVKTSCRFCGAAFQSKNALFRHLRESDACAAAAAAEDPRAPAAIAERKQHVATYLVGYGAGKGADAEAALASLCSASSVTRATAVAARGRSAALALGDAAAARDVLSVVSDSTLPAPSQLNKDLPSDIRVLSSRPGRVHAESSATQRAFHYLLPLCWLAGAKRTGAERVAEGATTDVGKFGVRRPAHAPRGGDAASDVTRRALRQLKTALRAAVATTGAWHNFADPELRGLLSPFAVATCAEIIELNRRVNIHAINAGGDAHAPPPRARRGHDRRRRRAVRRRRVKGSRLFAAAGATAHGRGRAHAAR